MLDRLPLNALRAFVVAARHESFKTAAAELHVTPGAVSRHVKQLETSIGAALFVRHARGVRLTGRGLRLAESAGTALDQLAHAMTAARTRPRSAPQLTVSASPSFIQHWLLPRLPDFEAAYPGIDLALEATVERVEPAWQAGHAQLAIRYGRGPWPGVRSQRLMTETLFPVCAPSLLRSGQPLAQPADLAHHNLLHVEWLSHQADLFPGWRDWLDAAGAPQVDAGTSRRYSLVGLALDQAIAGRGVALATSVLAADRLAAGVLVRPFGPHFAMVSPFTYDLLMRSTGKMTEPAAIFADWLVAEAGVFVGDDLGIVAPATSD